MSSLLRRLQVYLEHNQSVRVFIYNLHMQHGMESHEKSEQV